MKKMNSDRPIPHGSFEDPEAEGDASDYIQRTSIIAIIVVVLATGIALGAVIF